MEFKIKLISPWAGDLSTGDIHLSPSYTTAEANALLCDWAPHEVLLSFPGPKAWYCCEATSNSLFKTPAWRSYLRALKPVEFLYHAHPDPYYRVPHNTHYGSDEEVGVNRNRSRRRHAVAIVTNSGGPPWRRRRDISLRVKYILHPSVDLYGRRENWQHFRQGWLSRPGLPPNYRGEVDQSITAWIACASQYQVAVCLENTFEPYYFTEKFVMSVRAGCIPVYHAHPTLKAGILQGAAWVDPADFGFDVGRTLEYAFSQDSESYRTVNCQWLKSEAVRATHAHELLKRIGRILYQESLQGN